MDENADGGVVTSVATENATSVTVDDDRFEVADGNLKLAAGTTLDFESNTSPIEVTITASGAGESDTHTVSVSINDVNEAPSISVADGTTPDGVAANSTIDENADGVPVGEIMLSDPDAGDTHTLSVDDDRFETSQDAEGGWWLKLKDGMSLDHEEAGSVTVTVTVTDDGDPAMSASTDVTIAVTDANDDPEFARASYAFNLSENEDGSTTAVSLGMVSATDEDAADKHTFSITAGNGDGLFAIDSASGEISYVGTGEDYRSSVTGPSHTLTIEVSDGTSTAEATVAITILNANDAPEFGASSYAFDLAENTDGSTTAVDVGMVSATDTDEGDAVTYSITGGNDDSLFAIDSASGAITYVGMGEDAESGTASHELTVSASDGSAMSEVMVTVNVTNANDSAPMFGEDSYAFDLAENADGSATAVAVGMVSATDADADTLEYSISGGNGDGLFAIDSASGAITYVGMGENYESATKSHELMVEASDGANSDSATVTVSVTDANDAPMADTEIELGPLAFVSGKENSMEVDLKALFSDPDHDDLTYSLSGNPDWLEYEEVRKGTGADQTLTMVITGDPPAAEDDTSFTVSITASDGSEQVAAMFEVVVDKANAAPTRLTFSTSEDTRTDSADVDENVEEAEIGTVTVVDPDDPDDDDDHPHGQHDYTFYVDGEKDDRFEVVDGILKLKKDVTLSYEDYEDDGGEFELTIKATDRAVGEVDEDDDTRESIQRTITIDVQDEQDQPVANVDEFGDWWVTIDEDLEADNVDEGEWLSFGLDTTGSDAAFTDPDGDRLTYSLGDDAPDWLQIDSRTGEMTNKEDMLAEPGVYTITVMASDGETDPQEKTFKLAVAVGETDHSDNDEPDIRNVDDYDYTENDPPQVVAEFTVRDEDLPIAPHPYGELDVDFTATAEVNGRDVSFKDRFKLVREDEDDFEGAIDNDPETVQYEIHTKSEAELAVDDEGELLVDAKDQPDPVEPLDHETTDEIDFTVTVKDGRGLDEQYRKDDSRTFSIDIDDDQDEAPEFESGGIDQRSSGTNPAHGGVSRNAMKKTTTITVNQQEAAKQVIVVNLADAWSDDDSDDDDLTFDVDGRGDLPDWIRVYGDDEWDDIEDRRDDVTAAHRPTDVRGNDQVVVIVIDRTAATGDNESFGDALASFEIEATDEGNRSTTEKIVIKVENGNTDIAEDDEDDVVSIVGDPSGTEPLEMEVDLSLDPDLDGADDATLVVYTWSHDNATPDDDSDDVTISVSSTPQSLPLRNADGTQTYPVGTTFTATVQYYEIDPQTHAIIGSETYTDSTDDPTVAPEDVATTGVSFEVTTDATGLQVDITATGDAQSAAGATGNVWLQSSPTGTGNSWTRVDTGDADTSAGTATDVDLNVDANADGTDGDGGGLYYRVVYSYTANDQTHTESYDVGQLGDVTEGDPTTTTPAGNIIGGGPGDNPDVGETLRVANGGNDAEVQWQMRANANSPWTDIEGATHLELEVDSDLAGMMLRAKVTYTDDDDPATTNVDEEGWPIWIEYTEVLTVSGVDVTNDAPVATQASDEIRVELGAKPTTMGAVQPTKEVHFDASKLFFDPDPDDDLTYTITTVVPDLDSPATSATAPGTDADLGAGGSVYRVYTSEWNETDSAAETTEDVQQSLSIDRNTGMITYFTDKEQTHDGTDTDGTGNTLTFTIQATDNDPGTTTPPTATVTVRINVTPTAISFDDGNTTAANLSTDKMTPTAVTVADDTYTPADADSDPDAFRVAENVRNQPAVDLGDINVMDQNLNTDGFGTHTIKFSDPRFEARPGADTDGSTWEIWLKEDAVFDYEKDGDKAGTLTVTVTATDGGGLKTVGYFSIQITDVEEDAPPRPEAPDPPDPEAPGLEDDADDNDTDGPVVPPDDGGAFIDEDDLIGLTIDDNLLDDFVLAIDDIDIA